MKPNGNQRPIHYYGFHCPNHSKGDTYTSKVEDVTCSACLKKLQPKPTFQDEQRKEFFTGDNTGE